MTQHCPPLVGMEIPNPFLSRACTFSQVGPAGTLLAYASVSMVIEILNE